MYILSKQNIFFLRHATETPLPSCELSTRVPAGDEVGQDPQKPFEAKCLDRTCPYTGFRQLVIFAPYPQDEGVSWISIANGETTDMGRRGMQPKVWRKSKGSPFLYNFLG